MTLSEGFEAAHLEAQERMGELGYYYRWILNNFSPYVGSRVWDAGAGVGHVARKLAGNADAEFLLLTEYGAKNLKQLHRLFDNDKHVEVRFCDLLDKESSDFADMRLNTIITLDVLEHLEDDETALCTFHRNLLPGGRLLVKVPAHPFLFGTMDKASLHFRRYTRNILLSKMERAGFTVERLRYMNMAAVIPYFIKGRILKRQGNFSRSVNCSRLGFYNQLMPWLERIEQIIPPLFGLSLIAVGRKS